MPLRRGDVYLANLDPTKGSEQAGKRPVLIFEHDGLCNVGATVVVIPFTGNLRRAKLPTCLLIPAGEGGLRSDSVALCHQIRALDRSGLVEYWGRLTPSWLAAVERTVAFTLGMRASP